jgi:hypothetical protein
VPSAIPRSVAPAGSEGSAQKFRGRRARGFDCSVARLDPIAVGVSTPGVDHVLLDAPSSQLGPLLAMGAVKWCGWCFTYELRCSAGVAHRDDRRRRHCRGPPLLVAARRSRFAHRSSHHGCVRHEATRCVVGLHDKEMEEHPPPPPPGQPRSRPTAGRPDTDGFRTEPLPAAQPAVVVLIAVIVIGLVAAGLLAGELYARHRAESVVAAATECVQDKASVSFGATPLLLQLATGHYRNISIHTAGNRIGNARGMKADVRIDDVRLNGDAMGTVGALDAVIT